MKISEFKQLIKEEIKNILKENIDVPKKGRKLSDVAYDSIISEKAVDRIYHLEGILTTDNERNLQAVLSDIRSIPGVTTIDHREASQISNSKYFRAIIKLKVDPYPYSKEGTFGAEDILKEIEISMRQVKGVISFKRTEKPYSSEI